MATPFDWFRKYSKAIFVVMCLVMGSFILSAGVGGTGLDFFDQIGGAFSSGGNNETLAEAYGEKITARELQELRLQRQLANEFMIAAISQANIRQAESYLKELSNTEKKNAFGQWTNLAIKPLIEAKVKSAKGPQEDAMYRQSVFMTFMQDRGQFAMLWKLAADDARDKKLADDQRIIQGMERIAVFDMMTSGRGRQGLYFQSGIGLEQDRELLYFAMMLKKADQLGINYSPQAVDQLIESEAAENFSTKKDWNPIESRLRDRHKELTTSWLKTAIANEYRVRAVVTTMIGGQPTTSNMPGASNTLSARPGSLTPFELFEFYKDKCSESNFTLLEVNADTFLSQVTTAPTPKEREELFKKHINDEPDPSRERPGFKDPKKLKLEYVTLDAKDKRLTDALPKLKAGEMLLGAFASLNGNYIAGLTSAAWPHRAEESQMKVSLELRRDVRNMPYDPLNAFRFDPRDHSIYQPVPIIAALAALGGSPTPNTVATASGLLFRHVEIADHKACIPPVLQQALMATNPSFGTWLGASSLALAHLPKPVSELLYAKEIRDEYRKQQVRDLFEWDIKTLQDKLKEINAKPMKDFSKSEKERDKLKEQAKAEARKAIDEWIKERGLKVTGNKEARDKFALATDADLKVLNDLASLEPEGTNSLSKKFFESSGFTGAASPFEPDWFPSAPSGDGLDKPNHLVWLADEVAPRAYNNLKNADSLTNGEMTKRVDAAWKLAKARDLAKAKAEELSKKAQEITKAMPTNPLGVDKQLNDFAAQEKVRKLELERLALLKHSHGLDPRNESSTYVPSTIPKTSVTYPSPDFLTTLMDLRKKPLGEVVVLHDAPRTKYYVACMTARTEKSIEQFRDVFVKTSNAFDQRSRNALYTQEALPQEQFAAMRDAVDRIKAEAKYQETDAFKKYDKNNAQ